MEEVYCPKCSDYVEVPDPWGEISCPKCGLNGYWEEDCTQDYSDCWAYIEWDSVISR